MQEYGLLLLQRQDDLHRVEADEESKKLALLASGRFDFDTLWPDYFSDSDPLEETSSGEDPLLDPERGIDFSALDYVSPGDVDMEELLAMEEFFAQAGEE